MKYLYAFQLFLLEEFVKDKELTVTGCRPWRDYDTRKELGTVVDVAITKDSTAYPASKDGRVDTNMFEKFSIKVPKPNFVLPVGAIVTIVNGTATIYGERRNQLSVRAEDIKVAEAPAEH